MFKEDKLVSSQQCLFHRIQLGSIVLCVKSQITIEMPVSSKRYSTKEKEEAINRNHCSVTLAVSSYLEICLEILTLKHCIDGAIGLTYISTNLVSS